MIILKVLFHLLTLTFIITNGYRILNSTEIINEFKSDPEDFDTILGIWLIWMCIGVMSFNWIAFILLLFILFIEYISHRIFSPIWLHNIVNFIFGITSTLIGIFILVNAFHLKIDLLELIKPYLQF